MFKILLIVIMINLGILLLGRIAKGFFRDPVYNLLLSADMVLAFVGFTGSPDGNSLPSWLAVGVFTAAVIVPAILNKLISISVQNSNLKIAHKLLKMKYLVQPSVDVSDQIHYNQRILQAHEGNVTDITKEIERELNREHDPVKRELLLETLIEILIFAGDWEKGISIYNDKIKNRATILKPTLFIALARASFETMNWNLLWDCYWQLDSEQYSLEDPTVQKSLFFIEVIILAAYGKTEYLKNILKPINKGDAMFPLTPKKYWLGNAYIMSGKRERGEKLLTFSKKEIKKSPIYHKNALKKLEKREIKPLPKTEEMKFSLNQMKLRFLTISERKSDVSSINWVVKAFIAFCVAVFGFQLYLGNPENFYNLYLIGGNFRHLSRHGEWWRVINAMFLHANFLHIAFNMYVLWIFGPFLESFFGKMRIFIILVISGIAGNLASTYFHEFGVSIGASSSVFGLIGAMFVMLILYKDRWPEKWRKNQISVLLIMLAINVAIGLKMQLIDNSAHMGGFVGGIIVALILGAKDSGPVWRKYFSTVIFALLSLLLVFTLFTTVQFYKSSHWTTFGFKKKNVSISYPSFWLHGEAPDNIKLNIPGDDSKKVDFFYSYFCNSPNEMVLYFDGKADILAKNWCVQNGSLFLNRKIENWDEYRINRNAKKYLYCYYTKSSVKKRSILLLFKFDKKCKKNIEKYIPKIIHNIKY